MPLWDYELGASENYLYHYTRPETLARILLNGSLRMGPYAGTRDPRENQGWFPNLTGSLPGDADLKMDAIALWDDLDRALRRRAKVACLTMDLPSQHMVWANTARGWGRARMWEQYADRHRGAVLVFDADRLAQATAVACGAQPLLAGPVKYTEGPWNATLVEGVPIADVVSMGAIAVADQLITSKGMDLFFTKDADWVSEAEYRFVTVDQREAVSVDIRDSLIGLALGLDYPDYELAVLDRRLELAGCPDVNVARVHWMQGYPTPLPVV